jgi:hypothetical protein
MTSTSLPVSTPPAPAKPRGAPTARRLVLVPAAAARGDELVRRYRLARLRLEPREMCGEDRFAHLRGRHD